MCYGYHLYQYELLHELLKVMVAYTCNGYSIWTKFKVLNIFFHIFAELFMGGQHITIPEYVNTN